MRHGQLADKFYLFIQTPLATDEASLAWSLYIVRTSTVAKNWHLNLVLQAELYLRTGTYDWPKNTLVIDSACTPLDSVLGQLAEQFYLFIQTPLDRRATFSFKHHLTGEAWPACRAILPLHSNTT